MITRAGTASRVFVHGARLRPGAVLLLSPALAVAQATSPFMTGANALQTNILAWLTPIAVILVMVLGAMAMANRVRSELAERLRDGYRERVALRLGQAQEQRTGEPARPAAAADLEEVRHRARQEWLRMRGQSGVAASRSEEPALQPADDELSR